MPNITRETFLAKLEDAYTVYFDSVSVPEGVPFLAACYDFICMNEGYILSKKVTIWSAETNEYAYVFSLPELTAQNFVECREAARNLGMKKIHPSGTHRSSNITALFICDRVLPEAAKAVRSTRIHKDFLFSFHGWMDFKCAALDLGTGESHANRAGADLKTMLRNNLEKCQLN